MRVSFQAWFYTLLDQNLNAINHTAGKDLWRAATQMCPFKHLLTSQLWTNQSPTGWSTGDGKSHLHRDVKTHSTTTEKSIIKHYRQKLKVFLHPSCYSCTPGKLLPWRAKGQAKETSPRARLTTCSCQKYQNLHHAMRLETHSDNKTLGHRFATSFILCKYFAQLWSAWNGKLEGKEGREGGTTKGKRWCHLWHWVSPDNGPEQHSWLVGKALKSPAACDLWNRRSAEGCLLWYECPLGMYIAGLHI